MLLRAGSDVLNLVEWHQMRTTLNIEAEALELIKAYAEERNISLGQAASDLVYIGKNHLPKFKTKNGWVVHDLPLGSPPLTPEYLSQLEAQDIEDEFQRAMAPRR
jgi:hypothetical protein